MTKLSQAELLERCKTLKEVEDWYADNGGYLVTVQHSTAFEKAMKRAKAIGVEEGKKQEFQKFAKAIGLEEEGSSSKRQEFQEFLTRVGDYY